MSHSPAKLAEVRSPPAGRGAERLPVTTSSGRDTRGQLRALLWLRSRELLGHRRGARRLRVLAAVLLGWIVLAVSSIGKSVELGVLSTSTLLQLAGVAWVLWALVPGLGGGANEVASTQRLAPYPVHPRPVFTASWASSMLDVPYLTVGPLVLGLSAAIGAGLGDGEASLTGGAAGLLAAIAFVAGASGLGQLAAWGATWVLAGRRAPGRTALWGVGVAGLALILGRSFDQYLPTLATLTPGGWLQAAAEAAARGQWAIWGGWVGALILPALLAPRAGGRLVRAAWGREARAQGAESRPWGEAGWSGEGSVGRAVLVAQLRSILRAPAAQVALAGVLLVPASARLAVDPATGVNPGVPLTTIGAIAGVSVALAIGCNALGYLAGGTTWLMSAPLERRTLLRASAVAVGLIVLIGQLATTLEAWVLGGTTGGLLAALTLAGARTLALAGAAVRWSVAHPSHADFDSLRTRIAAPRAVAGFLLAATTCNLLVGGVAQAGEMLGHPLLGIVGAYVAAGLLGWGWLALGRWRLHRRGTEQLALEVRG